jgi:beta-alanine degradation protein BauB
MSDQTSQLGDVGTALLFENERVKVWEMDLQPGEESDLHRHDQDYILVIIEGDRIAGVPPEGVDSAKYIEAGVEPGKVYYQRSGGTETARNVGERRYYEILIELKD